LEQIDVLLKEAEEVREIINSKVKTIGGGDGPHFLN
jgi:hypothetical protein